MAEMEKRSQQSKATQHDRERRTEHKEHLRRHSAGRNQPKPHGQFNAE
jgi:hypothetical protein